ncbi:MAG: undecaprenyl-diphosphate phosphatase [Bacteroidota bacterium]|nr:undecaprenyl-diphosphate phosphatase [Bacteroidota bacterium]
MNVFEAFFLGLIQGLTEFLPVSSSGHLEIFKKIFGDMYKPQESFLFTLLLHFATAISTIIVFRKDILIILRELFQFKKNESLHFSTCVIISMIPAAFIGLFYENFINDLFQGNLILVGGMLLITAFLLFQTDHIKITEKKISYRSALYIGLIQAIAILPGLSRSGATIAMAIIIGVNREKASRFSFLMVIPLIIGGMGKNLLSLPDNLEIKIDILFVGFVSALITGIFACKLMIALVNKSKLKYFGLYCLIVGFISIYYAST